MLFLCSVNRDLFSILSPFVGIHSKLIFNIFIFPLSFNLLFLYRIEHWKCIYFLYFPWDILFFYLIQRLRARTTLSYIAVSSLSSKPHLWNEGFSIYSTVMWLCWGYSFEHALHASRSYNFISIRGWCNYKQQFSDTSLFYICFEFGIAP